MLSNATLVGCLLISQANTVPASDGILAGGADPTIVAVKRDDGSSDYFVASTGRGIQLSHATDLKNWKRIGRVFAEDVPQWAKQEVPKASGIWAPDLSFHDGLYYMYYSVSSFGSQRSVIGLAVNKTLDQQSSDYRWIDRGLVIRSQPGQCDFNAIDPALFVDNDGSWYLSFGSFWSGIKLIQLDATTGKPAAGATPQPVAARPRHPAHAIEAPFIIFRDGYYYMFVSWDRCCDGADSDYKVMVGRSRKVTGPYVDAKDRGLLAGGGTLVLENSQRWRGPGHNSVLTTDDGQWMVHHTYDVKNLRARRVLQIRPMSWTDAGWPQVGEPIFEPAVRQRKSILRQPEPTVKIDLNDQTHRQVVVDREKDQYLGHPTTCLLEDGKTILCVYPKGHGKGAIVYKRSSDGGQTWSDRLPTPASWSTSKEVPTLHRVIGPDGTKRIIMWSGLYPARLAVTEDDGVSWSELKPAGDWGGIVVMGFVEALSTGRGHYLAMFHDDGRFFAKDGERSGVFKLYKTFSYDGGLTWSQPEVVYQSSEVHLCEPGCIRGPQGKQLAVLLRENARRKNSHVIFSSDEGKTWSAPREVPLALTGDRHTGKYAPDGRLFISFRCISPTAQRAKRPYEGDWVGWVGSWNDIVNGGDGQYVVRLKDNTKSYDTSYPGVECLPDGTFVTTTYGHWLQDESPYILSVRLKLSELDTLAKGPK